MSFFEVVFNFLPLSLRENKMQNQEQKQTDDAKVQIEKLIKEKDELQ